MVVSIGFEDVSIMKMLQTTAMTKEKRCIAKKHHKY